MCAILIALLILYLSFFIREGFNPYQQVLRLPHQPKPTGNLYEAQLCIQNIIDSGVTQKQGDYLDDLLNLLQFI